MTDNFVLLLKDIERKQKSVSKANTQLSDMIAKRNSICEHEHTAEKEYYHEGGYLNTDYTEYWNQCTCCGAKSVVTTENHGNYN